MVRLRSMLDDPQFSFQKIGQQFGLTKQRISQLAREFGIDGRKREHERTLTRVIEKDYNPGVQAVIKKIERYGIRALPYNRPQPNRRNQLRRSQRMVLVNGVLCVIQLRPTRKLRPNGREYARFDVGPETRRAKAAVFAMQKGRSIKLYVMPTAHLRNVSARPQALFVHADGILKLFSGVKICRGVNHCGSPLRVFKVYESQ